MDMDSENGVRARRLRIGICGVLSAVAIAKLEKVQELLCVVGLVHGQVADACAWP